MPTPPLRVSDAARAELAPALAAVREAHQVPGGFPPDVLAEAEEAARRGPADDLPELDVPFVTLDPADSRDLDQALHLARRPGGGYTVRYAIADLASFVAPDGRVAAAAWERVLTVYCPDVRVPLHPPVLSEQAASLWPDGPRPAVVWTIGVDADGATGEVDVRRALVRSRAKLDYEGVQAALDGGTAGDMLGLLPELGELLARAQLARGGSSLPLPSQEVVATESGYRLEYRRPLPVEDWNAQLSLLTGRAAAGLMVQAGVGVLRTMPPPDTRDERRLQRAARALGIDWPDGATYGEVLAALPPATSGRVVAFLNEAADLYRGAAYVAFTDGAPAQTEHAAIGAPYAHCTAPIRRLVDRFASQVCLAVAAGRPVPEWVLAALPVLPDRMVEGGRRTGAVERESLDAVERAVLEPYRDEELAAVVIEVRDEERGEVAVAEPAVIATCRGRLALGESLWVRLDASGDAADRQVRFVRSDA